MTMHYKVMVGGQQKPHQIEDLIDQTFSLIDTVFNNWNSQSELSKLNQYEGLEPTPISARLEDFLQEVDTYVSISEGRFDPTIARAQQLWKKYLKQGLEPPPEEIERELFSIGWNKLKIESGTCEKMTGKLELDLGGVAKGYAIDLLLQEIVDAGFPDAYVEWGGEIRASGTHPSGRPWRVFISNLGETQPQSNLGIIELSNQAIATSGDYLQFWNVGEKRYTHIINPSTGIPLEVTDSSIASVTVVAPTCAFADFVATTLMLFDSQDEALAWTADLQKTFPDLHVQLHSRAG